jgi:hypothetical protein
MPFQKHGAERTFLTYSGTLPQASAQVRQKRYICPNKAVRMQRLLLAMMAASSALVRLCAGRGDQLVWDPSALSRRNV